MEQRPPRLAVVGLGFIGLPLALCYALRGAHVVGVDVNRHLVKDINEGRTSLQESYEGDSIEQILSRQLQSGRFFATADYERAASHADSYMVTVGIPIVDGHPDMSQLRSACRSLGQVLKPGDLVLIRSTVVPGTTEGLIRQTLQQESGLCCGSDFFLAYSSERIAEGRAFEEFMNMPLAVGAVDEDSLRRAVDLLAFISSAEIHTSEICTVETAKIMENLQRDINIAVVQEFARFTEALGMDTHEMIDIANTHHRVNLLRPGPGVGGYCLPNALYYLLPRASELDLDLPLSRLARSTNDGVPAHLCQTMRRLLAQRGRRMQQAQVGILGLAMKDYSSDDRHSPARRLAEQLLGAGAAVRGYDPVVPNRYPYSCASLQECVTGAHGLIVAARQRCFDRLDWVEIAGKMADDPVIMDTRNCVSEDGLPEEVHLWKI